MLSRCTVDFKTKRRRDSAPCFVVQAALPLARAFRVGLCLNFPCATGSDSPTYRLPAGIEIGSVKLADAAIRARIFSARETRGESFIYRVRRRNRHEIIRELSRQNYFVPLAVTKQD